MLRNAIFFKQDQYEFIHEALLEHMLFGDTSFPVAAFRESYKALKTTDKDTNISELTKQFKVSSRVDFHFRKTNVYLIIGH